jgi:hypothetical protein
MAVDAQVAETLSALAYLGAGQPPERQLELISGLLAEAHLPTRAEWRVVWGPAEVEGDLAYIASGPGGQHAVVIRGTIVDNVFDMIQDSEVGSQLPLRSRLRRGDPLLQRPGRRASSLDTG